MWEDSVGPALALQSELPVALLLALRVVAGLLVGFAVAVGCGLLAALACLDIERRERTSGAAA